MSKINAQTVNERKKKKIIIIFLILIFLLISLSILLRFLIINTQSDDIKYGNFQTVEEVLKYYNCKYISEKESDLSDYDIDIKLEFAKDLYDGDTSNEKFFNNIINDVAKVLRYSDFRMIDEKRNIEIEVICTNYKVSQIIINGIENYYIYMDSQKDLAKYIEIEKKELQIESPEIQNLINNNWDSKTAFGTRESIFENYYNYFDEGISARTIDGKIYNIVFTPKYKGNVINGIFPGMDNKNVKTKLGEPSFEDEELNVIGYKGKEIYVFFSEKEISVYRVSTVDSNEFFKLADKLLTEELDLLDFMNELTYLWPDYSEYDYNETSVFLSYPLRGVDIKIGYEDTNAIIFYNNINANTSIIKKYLEYTEFVSRLKIDNVFEAEKRRVSKNNELLDKCKEYIKTFEENDIEKSNKSMKFELYADIDSNNNIIKLNFISTDGNNPNRELYDSVSEFTWINSDIIIFSQNNVGIYTYNIITGKKETLIKGDESYNLKSFENGILKYDNSELIIQY